MSKRRNFSKSLNRFHSNFGENWILNDTKPVLKMQIADKLLLKEFPNLTSALLMLSFNVCLKRAYDTSEASLDFVV